MAPEFTYCVYAMAAGFLSFILVKPNVNYGFYFFVMTRTASRAESYLETKNEDHRYNFG